jgi:LPS-assembly protein
VENTLEAGPAGRLQLRLDQDVDLRRGKLAESTLALSGVRGPLGAGAQLSLLAFGGRPPRDPRAEYRSGLDAFTRLEAYATARDLRGDALTAGVSSVGPGAVGAQAAGVDALFDLRPGTQSAAATLNLSGKTRLDAANISYVAALAARRTDLPCGGGTISHRDVGGMEKQTAEVVWDSPCHCFAAGVKVTYDACGTFGYGLQLDLSRLMQGARAR